MVSAVNLVDQRLGEYWYSRSSNSALGVFIKGIAEKCARADFCCMRNLLCACVIASRADGIKGEKCSLLHLYT